MAHYVSNAPFWAIILFLASFIYAVVYITRPVRIAALNAGISAKLSRNIQWGILGFYGLYLIYASVLALNGVLDVDALPPRAMVWAGFPLMIILFGFIGNTKLFRKLLHSITLEALIALHVFRLAGVFFLVLLAYHLLPARFALFAGLGDIITAIFVYPVARMAARQKHGWKTIVYIWNIFGLMDIVDLLVVALMTGANGNLREMAIFPFVWFPAFAPATILFLHTAIFRKLHQMGKTTT